MTDNPEPGWGYEFSRPLQVGELDDDAKGRQHLEADGPERAALARRFDLLSLDRLEADLDYERRGRVVDVTGRFIATVTQTCVVTLEPVSSSLEDSFAARFDPDLVPDEFDVSDMAPEDLLDDEDAVPLVGDKIDLGEVVAECLGLAIDPYPRKIGSSTDSCYAGSAEPAVAKASPFDVLKKLKL